jgi:hypothetical protein
LSKKHGFLKFTGVKTRRDKILANKNLQLTVFGKVFVFEGLNVWPAFIDDDPETLITRVSHCFLNQIEFGLILTIIFYL